VVVRVGAGAGRSELRGKFLGMRGGWLALMLGCSSLPTSTRDAGQRDAASLIDAGNPPVDAPTAPDVPGAEVPVVVDAGVVDVPAVTTDVPVATDVPGATGLRLLRAGVVTVGPAASAMGPLQIVDQGIEGADRQCSGALCWTGSVAP